MTDFAVPNLPSRGFDATVGFYGALGFDVVYRAEDWLILRREQLQLEFFPDPVLDPAANAVMCCLRVDDLDAWYRRISDAGVPEGATGFPRRHPPKTEVWGGRVAYLVDPDGTQLTLVQNG